MAAVGPTDGRRDRPSCRDSMAHLKKDTRARKRHVSNSLQTLIKTVFSVFLSKSFKANIQKKTYLRFSTRQLMAVKSAISIFNEMKREKKGKRKKKQLKKNVALSPNRYAV